MRIAVVADLHANLPALEAVLEAMAPERPDRLICLGDLVGYNAQPAETVALIRRHADLVVRGNHDSIAAIGQAPPGTNSVAAQLAAWTRERLSEDDRRYLESLPSIAVVPGAFVAVHGCFLSELTHATGYVTLTTLDMNLAAIASNDRWPKLALCGHTHHPIGAWIAPSGRLESRLDEPMTWPASADAILVNPGSVGQPRDGDPRAAFALLDLEARTAEVRRVEYDIDRTVRANEDAGFPAAAAERLRSGR